ETPSSSAIARECTPLGRNTYRGHRLIGCPRRSPSAKGAPFVSLRGHAPATYGRPKKSWAPATYGRPKKSWGMLAYDQNRWRGQSSEAHMETRQQGRVCPDLCALGQGHAEESWCEDPGRCS
ncbi:unnamed protein product, partial [Pylaiella littoralis]